MPTRALRTSGTRSVLFYGFVSTATCTEQSPPCIWGLPQQPPTPQSPPTTSAGCSLRLLVTTALFPSFCFLYLIWHSSFECVPFVGWPSEPLRCMSAVFVRQSSCPYPALCFTFLPPAVSGDPSLTQDHAAHCSQSLPLLYFTLLNVNNDFEGRPWVDVNHSFKALSLLFRIDRLTSLPPLMSPVDFFFWDVTSGVHESLDSLRWEKTRWSTDADNGPCQREPMGFHSWTNSMFCPQRPGPEPPPCTSHWPRLINMQYLITLAWTVIISLELAKYIIWRGTRHWGINPTL